jgi:uncharacterized protein YjbI with pentapeptide repeats
MSKQEDLDALKKRKEIEKLSVDIENARSTLGLERFKAFAALLGPVMTAATVLGTVYIGYLQISEKSRADEDERWRQTIVSISGTKPGDSVSPHVTTLLKPFLESDRYRALAIGVTVDELPQVRDLGTFQSLFNSAFPKPDHANFPLILNLGRRMNYVAASLYQAIGAESDSKKANALRDEWNLVLRMAGELCRPVAETLRSIDHRVLLRDFSSGQTTLSKLPLDNIYFFYCDFNNIDFEDVDLTDSIFDQVNLDGANLLDVLDSSKNLWAGNIWWRAKAIDSRLLPTLIEQYKPYMFPSEVSPVYRNGEEIQPRDWEINVKRLCRVAQLSCSDEQIKADFPKSK